MTNPRSHTFLNTIKFIQIVNTSHIYVHRLHLFHLHVASNKVLRNIFIKKSQCYIHITLKLFSINPQMCYFTDVLLTWDEHQTGFKLLYWMQQNNNSNSHLHCWTSHSVSLGNKFSHNTYFAHTHIHASTHTNTHIHIKNK